MQIYLQALQRPGRALGSVKTEKTLGGKLHKVGEELCEAEVTHHANRCPQYFCGRPEKHVQLYKKALGVNAPKTIKKKKGAAQSQSNVGEWEQDGEEYWVDPCKRVTKPHDLELYERRLRYPFQDFSQISPYLPEQTTPMEQVARASVFEFFRSGKAHTPRGMSQTRCRSS